VSASLSRKVPNQTSDRSIRQWLGNGALVVSILYLLLFAFYAAAQGDVFGLQPMNDLANDTLPLALAAAGGTIVMLTGGFDLSVAGVISLVNVCIATQVGDGPFNALWGLLLAILIGLAVGMVNDALVAVGKLQSIASTLATMIVCSGLAIVVLDAPGGNVPDFIADNATDPILGVFPAAGAIALVVVLLWLVVRSTAFGVALYAVGADETAASLAGVPVLRTKFLAYSLGGICYGLAGFMLSAVTATGSPSAGTPFLLLMFAAIAIGGTSFAGGYGGPIGSMVGAALLVLLQKALFSAGVSSFYTVIFQGAIMILAVLVGGISASIAAGRSR
jgi:ribose transport system permease protein